MAASLFYERPPLTASCAVLVGDGEDGGYSVRSMPSAAAGSELAAASVGLPVPRLGVPALAVASVRTGGGPVVCVGMCRACAYW